MSSAPTPPNRDIPPERQRLYYAGMAVTGLGLLLFLSNFCIMPLSVGRGFPSDPGGMMFGFMGRAVGGMLLIAAGQAMQRIGARGWAGSGILPNPRQARRGVEPWARMGGGIVNDALEEVDAAKRITGPPSAPEPVVKVRCRQCGALNDEHNKFCGQCGREL